MMKKRRVDIPLHLFVMFIITIVFLFILVLVQSYSYVYAYSNYYPEINDRTIVILDNLNETQEFHVESIIRETKPLYFSFVHQINVTSLNISHRCGNLECGGVFLRKDKEIVIEYNAFGFKRTLCHEIIHSFVYSNGEDWNEPIHDIVFDLSNEGVCYK